MRRILFVCMGNICRSPIAQGVLESICAQRTPSLNIQFDSAGTLASHRGAPPDPRAIRAAAARNYDISKQRARQVIAKDFDVFDHIFAMDRDNYSSLMQCCPSHATAKVALFLPYTGIFSPDELPDPYYGNAEGFERVMDLCEDAGRRLVHIL